MHLGDSVVDPCVAVAHVRMVAGVAVVVDGEVQRVGAGTALSGEVVIGVVAGGGKHHGVAVVEPCVTVAHRQGIGTVRVVVDGEVQGVDAGAVLGIGVVVGVVAGEGVVLMVVMAIPVVEVAHRGVEYQMAAVTDVEIQRIGAGTSEVGVVVVVIGAR